MSWCVFDFTLVDFIDEFRAFVNDSEEINSSSFNVEKEHKFFDFEAERPEFIEDLTSVYKFDFISFKIQQGFPLTNILITQIRTDLEARLAVVEFN